MSSKCRPVVGSSKRKTRVCFSTAGCKAAMRLPGALRAHLGAHRQRGDGASRRLGQVARELQALRLAAGERGHRLAETQVVEAHVDERLAGAVSTSGWPAKNGERLVDRELEHVGDAAAVPPSTSRISSR